MTPTNDPVTTNPSGGVGPTGPTSPREGDAWYCDHPDGTQQCSPNSAHIGFECRWRSTRAGEAYAILRAVHEEGCPERDFRYGKGCWYCMAAMSTEPQHDPDCLWLRVSAFFESRSEAGE